MKMEICHYGNLPINFFIQKKTKQVYTNLLGPDTFSLSPLLAYPAPFTSHWFFYTKKIKDENTNSYKR